MKFGSGGSCCASKLIERASNGAIGRVGRVGTDTVASSLVTGDSSWVADSPPVVRDVDIQGSV